MRNKQVLLGLILLGLGAIGILSLLTMEIPLPPEAEEVLKEKFTSQQIKLLTLINPTIMLMIAVTIGTLLHQKVNLKIPLIERLVGINNVDFNVLPLLKYGVFGGILAGILLCIVSLLFNPILPAEFLELGESLKPTLATRFLYGGLTEEILMRYGLMTLIVWIASKVFNGTEPIVYWTGIVFAALFFTLGHFPVALQAIENPSTGLLTYLIVGNTIGGIIFGWLYWKKGLESAFLVHIFAHVIMIIIEPMIN